MRAEDREYSEQRIQEGPKEIIYIKGERGIKRMIVSKETTEKEKEKSVKAMIRGVTHGYKDKITIKGVGYRATQVGSVIEISIGYKSAIQVGIPTGIEVKVKGAGTIIEATGTSKQKLREYLSTIVEKRPASKDKYNGKGIEKWKE
jgi:ribosomal protein L6P/L9E